MAGFWYFSNVPGCGFEAYGRLQGCGRVLGLWCTSFQLKLEHCLMFLLFSLFQMVKQELRMLHLSLYFTKPHGG